MFKTKEEAINYATDKVKTFRDSLDGVEVWGLPNKTFDVNHTMNSNGRNWLVQNKATKLETIYRK
jgi:hypothetical protein